MIRPETLKRFGSRTAGGEHKPQEDSEPTQTEAEKKRAEAAREEVLSKRPRIVIRSPFDTSVGYYTANVYKKRR